MAALRPVWRHDAGAFLKGWVSGSCGFKLGGPKMECSVCPSPDAKFVCFFGYAVCFDCASSEWKWIAHRIPKGR